MLADSLLVEQVGTIVSNPLVIQLIVTLIVSVIAYIIGLFKVSNTTIRKILEYAIIILNAVEKANQKEAYAISRSYPPYEGSEKHSIAVNEALNNIIYHKYRDFYSKLTGRLGGLDSVVEKTYQISKNLRS